MGQDGAALLRNVDGDGRPTALRVALTTIRIARPVRYILREVDDGSQRSGDTNVWALEIEAGKKDARRTWLRSRHALVAVGGWIKRRCLTKDLDRELSDRQAAELHRQAAVTPDERADLHRRIA